MKALMNNVQKFSSYANNKLSELCGYLLFIIMVLLIINIVSRELGNAIPGINTIAVLTLIAVVYLGLSRTEEHDEHAAVDILETYLSLKKKMKKKRLHSIVVNIVKLITISAFFYVSIGGFIDSYQSGERFADVVKIPIWPAKLAIAIGLFFFIIQIFVKLQKDLSGAKHQIKDQSNDNHEAPTHYN